MNERDAIGGHFFAALPRPVDFYILRHGESEANASGRIQGLSDYPLNENGRMQAAAAGAWFADRGITRVFASPLERAAETAAIVCRKAGLPDPIQEPLLMELDTGRFSGLNILEIRERHPEDHERFSYLSWDGVTGAESSISLEGRARSVWELLRASAADSGGNVLVVTHGGMIQWLVRVTFGCGSWMPLLPTGNCCVYHLSVEPNGNGRPAFVRWTDLNLPAGIDQARVPQVF
ncbi:MAG: histidine phosphatase family protein [Spirochaetales bacterium]|nr:MAG: histidine phosphatase family protein [Spirochaetales bacterium]